MNLNKKFLKSFAIILSFVLVVFLISRQTVSMGTVVLGGVEVQVELAQTAEGQSKGLSGRETIAEGEGMLFIFENEGVYSFWMKDMNFPIDIIWINKKGEVVHIKENASPESYPISFSNSLPAIYVLEVEAGFSDKYDIKLGDTVLLSI